MNIGVMICIIVGILAAMVVGVYFIQQWSEVQKIRYRPRSIVEMISGIKEMEDEQTDEDE